MCFLFLLLLLLLHLLLLLFFARDRTIGYAHWVVLFRIALQHSRCSFGESRSTTQRFAHVGSCELELCHVFVFEIELHTIPVWTCRLCFLVLCLLRRDFDDCFLELLFAQLRRLVEPLALVLTGND